MLIWYGSAEYLVHIKTRVRKCNSILNKNPNYILSGLISAMMEAVPN